MSIENNWNPPNPAETSIVQPHMPGSLCQAAPAPAGTATLATAVLVQTAASIDHPIDVCMNAADTAVVGMSADRVPYEDNHVRDVDQTHIESIYNPSVILSHCHRIVLWTLTCAMSRCTADMACTSTIDVSLHSSILLSIYRSSVVRKSKPLGLLLLLLLSLLHLLLPVNVD